MAYRVMHYPNQFRKVPIRSRARRFRVCHLYTSLVETYNCKLLVYALDLARDVANR